MESLWKCSPFNAVFLIIAVGGVRLCSAPQTAKPVTVRVPFVGCESGGQAGPVEIPTRLDKAVQIESRLAERFAYYESGVGRGVLAPRGWYCYGLYGSSGSAFIVTPERILGVNWPLTGPVVELDSTSGGTSGRFEVAQVIARVFPNYKAFVQSVIDLFDFFESKVTYGPYSMDKLTYKNQRIVEYRTPPNSKGLGTLTGRLRENGESIDGVAILEGATPDLLLLSVRLLPEMNSLKPAIIQQVEREAIADAPQN
jgi:hypothetical protein